MAKQPRLPPTDRPPSSDRRSRGVKPWPSSAHPLESVVPQDMAVASDNPTWSEEQAGPSLSSNDSGKLLPHNETNSNSYEQNQLATRPRQLPSNASLGNGDRHSTHATASANVVFAGPPNPRESYASWHSSDTVIPSGYPVNDRPHHSMYRERVQPPTAPKINRRRLTSKDQAPRTHSEAEWKSGETKQAAQYDMAWKRQEGLAQQWDVAPRRSSMDQVRYHGSSGSNSSPQTTDRQWHHLSQPENLGMTTDVRSISVVPQAPASYPLFQDRQHSPPQQVALNPNMWKKYPPRYQAEALSANTLSSTIFTRSSSGSDKMKLMSLQNPMMGRSASFGTAMSAYEVNSAVTAATGRRSDQNTYTNTESESVNTRDVNSIFSDAGAPLRKHEKAQGMHPQVDTIENAVAVTQQDNVTEHDIPLNGRAPAEQAITPINHDDLPAEQPTVDPSQEQNLSSFHHGKPDLTIDEDIGRDSRASTPLTPLLDAADIPADLDGALEPIKGVEAANVDEVEVEAEAEKEKEDAPRTRDADQKQAAESVPIFSPNKAAEAEPEPEPEPKIFPKSPSPPPMSPALPPARELNDNLYGPAPVLDADATTTSEQKHSTKLTKRGAPVKKSIYGGIDTSNIIPDGNDIIFSSRRTTRRAAKSSTNHTETPHTDPQATEQKPIIHLPGRPSRSIDDIKMLKGRAPRGFAIVAYGLDETGNYVPVLENGVPIIGESSKRPLEVPGRRSTQKRTSPNPITQDKVLSPEAFVEDTVNRKRIRQSSSQSRPADSNRMASEIREPVSAESLQDTQMDHIHEVPLEDSKSSRRRGMSSNRRKIPNPQKQKVIQPSSVENTDAASASNGEVYPDNTLIKADEDASQLTNKKNTETRSLRFMALTIAAETSTRAKAPSRKKLKAVETTSESILDIPDTATHVEQVGARFSGATHQAERRGNQVLRNGESGVQPSRKTIQPRNDAVNPTLRQIDEVLARQKQQGAILAQKLQEAQESRQQAKQKGLQEVMLQLEILKQQMILQIENFKHQTLLQIESLEQERMLRDIAFFTEQQHFLAQNEEILTRMREEVVTCAIALPAPKTQKKPSALRSGASALTAQDPEPRRGASKKRKADRDGESSYAPEKAKKRNKDGIEEMSKVDEAVGDSRQSKRSRKDYSTQNMDVALSDEEAIVPSERDQERKQIVDTIRSSLVNKVQEVQVGDCTLSRYDGYQKCKDCMVQSVTGSCRFRGWRVFPLAPKTGIINGEPWFDHQAGNDETLDFPTRLNRQFTIQHSFRMKETVVKALLPVITKELWHCVHYGARRKAYEIASRATCDRCSMTIFGGSWTCLACGKEFCFECEAEIPDTNLVTAEPLAEGSSKHRLLSCRQGLHSLQHLFATTTFDLHTLQFHWLQMIAFAERAGIPYDKQDVKQLLPNATASEILFPTIDIEARQPGEQEERERAQATDSMSTDTLKSYLTTRCHDSLDPPQESLEQFASHEFYRIDASKLDEALYDRMWRDGIPIVIDNAKSRLKENWTPQGFQELFRDEPCLVYDCQAEIAEESTVDGFFGLFDADSGEGDNKVLKLKDWPSNAEFKERCPTLNLDFHNTLPVPDYTRRDGITNVSAFFPTNANPPDIGPKLYAALRGIETKGGKGSTRMHMDIADAINVMTYASKREDGTEGCAIWHIYRKSDLDTIRGFLREKFSEVHQFVDPVHSQLFYLDRSLRQELFDNTGVYAHRIYQYPGQAVMIPAYCAHQVCNYSDCIKIACDFVSPHSISRCAQLTQEFRGENVVSDWKDDVLQLNSMMWYTWLYCLNYDVANDHALALPFDEASVGAFIDERSKPALRGQAGEGLAQLQPSRPTTSKLTQAKAKKDTKSPFWARPVRAVKPTPKGPPRRPGQSLPKPSMPLTPIPVGNATKRPNGSLNTSIFTGPPITQPDAIDNQASQMMDPHPNQQANAEVLHCATASSSILHQANTTLDTDQVFDLQTVPTEADRHVLPICATVPPAEMLPNQFVVN